jgi:DNA polymerase III subunit epsilon
MLQLWADCETTGIDPATSGAFEFTFLVFDGGIFKQEKVFHLNPLSETILFSEEAYKVNGVSEETIRSYPPAAEVIPELVNFLKKYLPEDKRMIFAGYNCRFDFGHLSALLSRYGGYDIEDYLDGELIDVYELVKKATVAGLLPKTGDQKLTTMTKALGIPHDQAHTALSDIWATRRLYEMIYRISKEKNS